MGFYGYAQSQKSFLYQVSESMLAFADMARGRATGVIFEADRQLQIWASQPDAAQAPTVVGSTFPVHALIAHRFHAFLAGQRQLNPLFSTLLCVGIAPAEQSSGAGSGFRSARVLFSSEREKNEKLVLPDFWVASNGEWQVNPAYRWNTIDTPTPRRASVSDDSRTWVQGRVVQNPFSPAEKAVVVSRDYRGADNQQVALVGIIDVSRIQQAISTLEDRRRDFTDATQKGQAALLLVDAEGEYVGGLHARGSMLRHRTAELLRQLRAAPGGFLETELPDMGKALVGGSGLTGSGWSVIAVRKSSHVLAPLARWRNTQLAAALLSLILFGAVGGWLYSQVSRPMQRLVQGFERYVNPDLLRDLDSVPDALVAGKGVQKHLTVLFVDVRGFTQMSESMAPEDVVKFLVSFFNRVSQPVFDAQGTVDKFIGDAMMAVFGFPLSYPDHATRAVRAAMQILQSVHEYNVQRKAWNLKPIEVGIGINSGNVIAGNVGCDAKLDYTVVGDAVNVASHLVNEAKPGQVLITAATYELVRREFPTRDLGLRQLKGRQIAVNVHEVVFPRADRDEEDTVRMKALPLPLRQPPR
jgi:class 3 adenylate cyclase